MASPLLCWLLALGVRSSQAASPSPPHNQTERRLVNWPRRPHRHGWLDANAESSVRRDGHSDQQRASRSDSGQMPTPASAKGNSISPYALLKERQLLKTRNEMCSMAALSCAIGIALTLACFACRRDLNRLALVSVWYTHAADAVREMAAANLPAMRAP
ncbi:MAG: hypothetical protein SGPRY_006788 [Prymnesium sp.]